MATSYAPLLLQAFDDYGVILSGGRLHTYEAGTTTPLATYQDLEGATPNENPVALDTAGRATVRVTNGVAYKFVLKDADGNTITTLDNIIVGTAESATTEIYPVHMTFCGVPAAGSFMAGWILEDAVTFPADFTGTGLTAAGAVKVAPAATYVISVKKNGDEVGTITIDTDGIFTFETTDNSQWSAAKYDQIDFYAPDGGGTAAHFTIVLLASVD